MSHKYKPGDLIVLNDYGVFIGEELENVVGIVISTAYNIVPHMQHELNSFYIVYDILLNGELIKMIPEEFMEFYKRHEKDTK